MYTSMETLLLFITLMKILTGTSIKPFSIVSSTKIIFTQGAKNVIFTACHSGKLKLTFTVQMSF